MSGSLEWRTWSLLLARTVSFSSSLGGMCSPVTLGKGEKEGKSFMSRRLFSNWVLLLRSWKGLKFEAGL
jgi:hypothetical protein